MQMINFFDDPAEVPKGRADVRLLQLGFYVYEGGRRVMVGFELTPFLERPSLEINITNENGERAASMIIVDTQTPNFSMTMHLRDTEPTDTYTVDAVLYYAMPNEERELVKMETAVLDMRTPGEQLVTFSS